jgi:hypothetical protein
MNGRLYDPKLHRFLQPDNFVQDPSNTQNYNRYGYVLNNPLKYTDPSGEITDNCPTCPDQANNFPDGGGAGIIKSIKDFFSNKENVEWLTRNAGQAGWFIGKNINSALKDVGGFFKRLFGGGRKGSSGPPPNMATNVNMNAMSAQPSMFNNFKSENNLTPNNATISLYNQHSIIPANTIGSYDYTGGFLTGVGTGLTAGEIKMFNQNSWFSIKKWTTYSQNFNGNGATGGKVASALKISNQIKWAGRGLGAYNGLSILNQYRNNEISGFSALMEESSNAYSTFGGLHGAAWGVGWEGGRAITKTDWYQNWKKEYWYPFRYEHFGY